MDLLVNGQLSQIKVLYIFVRGLAHAPSAFYHVCSLYSLSNKLLKHKIFKYLHQSKNYSLGYLYGI